MKSDELIDAEMSLVNDFQEEFSNFTDDFFNKVSECESINAGHRFFLPLICSMELMHKSINFINDTQTLIDQDGCKYASKAIDDCKKSLIEDIRGFASLLEFGKN